MSCANVKLAILKEGKCCTSASGWPSLSNVDGTFQFAIIHSQPALHMGKWKRDFCFEPYESYPFSWKAHEQRGKDEKEANVYTIKEVKKRHRHNTYTCNFLCTNILLFVFLLVVEFSSLLPLPYASFPYFVCVWNAYIYMQFSTNTTELRTVSKRSIYKLTVSLVQRLCMQTTRTVCASLVENHEN